MGMLDGASQCWWLSKNCVVNWDAWSAVGTLLAVCVAISVSLAESRRRKQDQEARAMWLRLELIQPMRTWQSDLFRFSRSLEKKRYFAVVEALRESTDSTQPLQVPMALNISSTRLHELGIAAKPLAGAVYLAQDLEKHSWLYVETFLELQDPSITEGRAANLSSAEDLMEKVSVLHTFVVLGLEELRQPFTDRKTEKLSLLRNLVARLGGNQPGHAGTEK